METNTNLTVAEMMRQAIDANGWKLKDFAGIVGKSPAALSTQLNTNRFSAEEWRRMARLAGYEVVMQPVSAPPARCSGHAPHIKRMVDGITYETSKADAVCWMRDPDGWARELYTTDDGSFFLAHFHTAEDIPGFITPVSFELAQRFTDLYQHE